MKLSDDPIEDASQDELSRLLFAKRAASLIGDSFGPESVVFSLVGPWGSGKTSLANLIKQELPEAHWCAFNPWMASSATELVADFFASIESVLPKEGAGKRAREAMARYSKKLAPPLLSLIPGVGPLLSGAAESAPESESDQTPLAEAFDEMSSRLSELKRPIVVVIDDIDRLQPNELLELLKAVRLLGRLPFIQYVLVYDETSVLEVLKQTAVARDNELRALSYLEKIVQVRLDIPPTQSRQSVRLLEEGLADLLSALDVEFSDHAQSRFSMYYNLVMSRTLTEPRAIHRYLTQVGAYLPLVGPCEIDLSDFLILTHWRVSFPSYYRLVRDSKDELLGREAYIASPARDGESRTDWSQVAMDTGVPTAVIKPLVEETARLFPGVNGSSSGYMRGFPRRVGDRAYFDRYFYFSIPEGEISDIDAEEALLCIREGRSSVALDAVHRLLEASDDSALRTISHLRRIDEGSHVEHGDFELLSWVLERWRLRPSSDHGIVTFAGQLEHWSATIIIRSLGREPDLARAASLFPGDGNTTEFFARCWGYSGYLGDDVSERLAPFFNRFVVKAVEAVGDHLDEGDAASTERSIYILIEFAAENDIEGLREAIRQRLDGGLTYDHLVARFVGTAYLLGVRSGNRRLAEVNTDALYRLVDRDDVSAAIDRGRLSEDVTRQLDGGPLRVDKSDVSWPNRRIVAVQAVMRERVDGSNGTPASAS